MTEPHIIIRFNQAEFEDYNKYANLAGGYQPTELADIADYFMAAISHELDLNGKGPLDQRQCEISGGGPYAAENPASGKVEPEYCLRFHFKGNAVDHVLELSDRGADKEWLPKILANYKAFLDGRAAAGAIYYRPYMCLRQ